MTDNQEKKGLSIHCHHDILVEYCTDYEKRVNYIKAKPKHEKEPRLKLFKLLPKEALNDLPKKYLKSDADWQKAYADRPKAYTKFRKADADWPTEEKDAFHKKWCGCKEWHGKELVFTKG